VAIFENLSTLSGTPLAEAELEGRAVLVVNVASRCGLTPQYTGLERLQERYGERGFTVLGAPCNQFGDRSRAAQRRSRHSAQPPTASASR
jgi:glutathione peroxidase